MIVLNSAEAALEVLEKRSAFHSDRPPMPMVQDPTLMNWPGIIAAVGYNDVWRFHRRILNNWLNVRTVSQFNDLQERQARLLLRRLLSASSINPDKPFEGVKSEIFFTMGSLMLRLAYGYEPQDYQDRFFREAQLSASGTHQPSILGYLLQDHKLLSGLSPTEREERLKELGSALFGAGADTTANFLVALVSAMVLKPHVQAKAQRELDTVLGQAVLPKIADKERLPYIKNLIDEVLRLYPVIPLGLPHACFQDDTYQGYDIQKGTIILGNLWTICRDTRRYADPEVLDPERYLDPQIPRPPVFGWGRRKCPGIHFAEDSTFIMTASLLAMFTFSKKMNGDGQEIIPRVELERNSLMFELDPFDFVFKPRSEEHYKLVL